MLPSASRLIRRSDFGRVYSRGKSYVTDLVVVYALPNKGQTTRIGFSVSKKLGTAVARNIVKRRLREAVRELLPDVTDGFDVIVVARVKAARATYSGLRGALKGLFEKAGILQY